MGDGFDRVERALEEHGCNPRGNAQRGVQALCPAHDDRTPSLSVLCGDRAAIIKCWSGCSKEDVLNALGLEWPDLFDEPLKGRRAP